MPLTGGRSGEHTLGIQAIQERRWRPSRQFGLVFQRLFKPKQCVGCAYYIPVGSSDPPFKL